MPDRRQPGSETPRPALSPLEGLLRRATVQGERGVAWARIVLTGVILGWEVWSGAVPKVLRGDHALQTEVGVLVLGLLFSVVTLRVLHDQDDVALWLYLSVALDAAMVTCATIYFVLVPVPAYQGFGRENFYGYYLLVAMAAGARVSVRVAWFGALLNGLILIAILLLDVALNGQQALPGVIRSQWIIFQFVGVAALGVLVSRRNLQMVVEGADAVLQTERVRHRLGAYVSEEVAAEAVSGGALLLGGRRQEVAVLFADIRDFTVYSAQLEPERLVSELNAYLEAMVEVIRAEGGVVDKYIGDAIMVVFGLPTPRGDECVRAIRCAAAMREALGAHNAARAAHHLPAFEQGIGVHYGPAVAGNIGTPERLQYTVIGDVVNAANRIEGATKAAQVPVLISEEAVAAAAGREYPALRRHGELLLPGRPAATPLYTLDTAAG